VHYRDSLVALLKKNLIQPPQYGAEVGVHRGRTSERLLLEFPTIHLYLVDTWGPPSESYAASNDPLSRLTLEEQREFFAETMDRMRHYPTRGQVLKMDSVEAISEMQELDFAFIDGDHSCDGCRRDVQAYWEIVHPGGILCGHDYDKQDTPGVKNAVDEFARERDIEVKAMEGNLWWFRKRR
jgi:hypothetical protein